MLEIEIWVEVQILVMTKFTGCMIGKTWRLNSFKEDGEDQEMMAVYTKEEL